MASKALAGVFRLCEHAKEAEVNAVVELCLEFGQKLESKATSKKKRTPKYNHAEGRKIVLETFQVISGFFADCENWPLICYLVFLFYLATTAIFEFYFLWDIPHFWNWHNARDQPFPGPHDRETCLSRISTYPSIILVIELLKSITAKADIYTDISFAWVCYHCKRFIFFGISMGIIVFGIFVFQMGFSIKRVLESRSFNGGNDYKLVQGYLTFLSRASDLSTIHAWSMCFRGITHDNEIYELYYSRVRFWMEDVPQFLLQMTYILFFWSESSFQINFLVVVSITMGVIMSGTRMVKSLELKEEANNYDESVSDLQLSKSNRSKSALDKVSHDFNGSTPKSFELKEELNNHNETASDMQLSSRSSSFSDKESYDCTPVSSFLKLPTGTAFDLQNLSTLESAFDKALYDAYSEMPVISTTVSQSVCFSRGSAFDLQKPSTSTPGSAFDKPSYDSYSGMPILVLQNPLD